MSTPRGTPKHVDVRPETVVILTGTTRLHARNVLVVECGSPAHPQWLVALVGGIDGRWWSRAGAERFGTREQALEHGLAVAAGRAPLWSVSDAAGTPRAAGDSDPASQE